MTCGAQLCLSVPFLSSLVLAHKFPSWNSSAMKESKIPPTRSGRRATLDATSQPGKTAPSPSHRRVTRRTTCDTVVPGRDSERKGTYIYDDDREGTSGTRGDPHRCRTTPRRDR